MHDRRVQFTKHSEFDTQISDHIPNLRPDRIWLNRFTPKPRFWGVGSTFVSSVIQCKIKSIEWLYLAAKGHRRAKFNLENNKDTWLVP